MTLSKFSKVVSAHFPNNRARVRFDDMLAMVGAAQAGLGVVPLPMFLGRAATGLVQIPVLPPQPFVDIWVLGHPDVWSSPKLRAFRDIFTRYCKLHSHQFVATSTNSIKPVIADLEAWQSH